MYKSLHMLVETYVRETAANDDIYDYYYGLDDEETESTGEDTQVGKTANDETRAKSEVEATEVKQFYSIAHYK